MASKSGDPLTSSSSTKTAMETKSIQERRLNGLAPVAAPRAHYYQQRQPRKVLESTSSNSSHPDHHDHQPEQATVREHQPFDASNDAKALFKAMEGLGTNENKIIDLLSKRSIGQRLEIRVAYKTLYGKDIIKAFRGELKIIFSGHLEDVIEALFKPPEVYDAELIHHAITGLSTDEDALIDIVCSRSNADLEGILKTYKQLYQKELVADIQGHVHSSVAFKKLLIALLTGTRDDDTQVNTSQAKWDARAMYDAGPKHWAKDSTFAPIFADRSYAHLKLVFTEFEEMADTDIEKVLGKDLHGDVGHLLESLAKFAKHKDTYFAELLHKSMKGHLGTNHKALIRTVVSRCEKDMVPIKERFQEQYHKSLGSALEAETSGHYRNILLALTGCHDELRKHDPAHIA
ncbi:Annexin A7 [Hypsibius exemplaris]|uniref:Annexin n=1 Tax=Hypsibius exemplaris TaxID=2072580 RepID=A0A1W0WQ29_HYPEX|nr:Annexin A7 [Hypsibius exemplaris]